MAYVELKSLGGSHRAIVTHMWLVQHLGVTNFSVESGTPILRMMRVELSVIPGPQKHQQGLTNMIEIPIPKTAMR